MITPELIAYLRRGIEKAGGGKGAQKRLAKAIGLTQGRVSRLINLETDHTISVKTSIRLAMYLDEPSPIGILKAANKEWLVLLLEPYMTPTMPRPSEQQLLEDWRALDPVDRPCWAFLIRASVRRRQSVPPPT